MPEGYTIQIKEENTRLRLDWDNREAPKDFFTFGCLVLCWIVWMPLTLVGTYCTIVIFCEEQRRFDGAEVFMSIWCVFGWVGTLLIPWQFLVCFWSEWIELTPETFTHGHEGFLAPKIESYAIGREAELTLGRYDEESIITLSLWPSVGGTNRWPGNVRVLVGTKNKRADILGHRDICRVKQDPFGYQEGE